MDHSAKSKFANWPEVRKVLKPTLILIAKGSDYSLHDFPVKAETSLRERYRLGEVNEETIEEYRKSTQIELEGLMALAADKPEEGFIVARVPPEMLRPHDAIAYTGFRTIILRRIDINASQNFENTPEPASKWSVRSENYSPS